MHRYGKRSAFTLSVLASCGQLGGALAPMAAGALAQLSLRTVFLAALNPGDTILSMDDHSGFLVGSARARAQPRAGGVWRTGQGAAARAGAALLTHRARVAGRAPRARRRRRPGARRVGLLGRRNRRIAYARHRFSLESRPPCSDA